MNNKRHIKAGILLLLWVFASFGTQAQAQPTLAYLDPGTGSYIFQILIAGLVGAGFAIKLFWGYIKLFVVSVFTKNKDNDKQP